MLKLAILSRLLGGDDPHDMYIEPLLRLERPLRARGIALVQQSPDVVLVDCDGIASLDAEVPLILFDRTDGGMLWWYGTTRVELARSWLRSPRVRGMIKISRYVSPELYNTSWKGGAYHLQQVHDADSGLFADVVPLPAPPLSDADLAKLRLGFGFWACPDCEPLAAAPVDLDAPRGIDVFCSVSVYYECPLVSHHRRLALEKVEQLRQTRTVSGRGRTLSHANYCELLRHSRICLSPWGWGETTIRDYEAMLAGCVLVKPRTDFIDSLLPLDERHYVPCAVDFADLQEKVAQVLSRWDDYTPMRRANRERLVAARRPEAMAEHFAGLLRSFLG
jgi:hypothetical protein